MPATAACDFGYFARAEGGDGAFAGGDRHLPPPAHRSDGAAGPEGRVPSTRAARATGEATQSRHDFNRRALPRKEGTGAAKRRRGEASNQRRVVDTLVKKAVRAAEQEQVKTLVLAGGVAANRELREHAHAAGEKAGLRVVVPPFRACTDNAAMIAYAGLVRLARGEDDTDTLTTSPRTSLLTVTKKGRGRRVG